MADLPNARDMRPLSHPDRDSLYYCSICGAITRYQDRLKHSKWHSKIKSEILKAQNEPALPLADPPPF
jgi:hypothetical protein